MALLIRAVKFIATYQIQTVTIKEWLMHARGFYRITFRVAFKFMCIIRNKMINIAIVKVNNETFGDTL